MHCFLDSLTEEVKQLSVGLPWEEAVQITPIDPSQKTYLEQLIQDAKDKGASVFLSGRESESDRGSLLSPVILFPITEEMRLWREEQFGPVLAVTSYQELAQVYSYVTDSSSGLQCSLFSADVEEVEEMSRVLVNAVGRVNVNLQSGRSPDEWPFTGRKSSANGILSTSEALRSFTLPIVLASKEEHFPKEAMEGLLEEWV